MGNLNLKPVLVAGGVNAFVHGTFGENLASHGLKVEWYVPHDHDFTGLPKGCAGVVVLKDAVSHILEDKVITEAKAKGIPFARVVRKWAFAENALRKVGLIVSGEPPPKINYEAFAYKYICDVRRSGRVPSRDQVREYLLKTFGHRVDLGHKALKNLYSRAAQEVCMTPPAVAPVATTPDTGVVATGLSSVCVPARPPELPEVREWANLLIEEDPNRLTNPEALAESVADHLKCQASQIKDIIANYLIDTKARIKSRRPADQVWHKNLMRTWLRSIYKECAFELPESRATNAMSNKVFGMCIPLEVSQDARADVYGEWARDILLCPVATGYLRKKYNIKTNLSKLLEQGVIPGLKLGKTWHTSTSQLDEYAKKVGTGAVIAVDPPAPKAVERKEGIGTSGTAKSNVHTHPPLEGLVEVMTMLKSISDRLAAVEARVASAPAAVVTTESTQRVDADLLKALIPHVRGMEVRLDIGPVVSPGGKK